MKTRNSFLKVTILSVIALSCQDEKKLEETKIPVKVAEKTVVEIPVNNGFTFLEVAPEQRLPIKDSTNFENFASNKILNQRQLDLIQSKKIADNAENFVVHYKVKLSPNFKTFVFTYHKGEMELFSTLVNYSNDYKFISKLTVAYDETAESWFRTESEITNSEVVVTELNYTDEVEKSMKTTYEIHNTGMITKK